MFLQIDLGCGSKTVTAIATQGHYSSWAFVQAYLLIFSRREGEWFYYKEGGVIKVIKSLKIFELNIQQAYVRMYAKLPMFTRNC